MDLVKMYLEQTDKEQKYNPLGNQQGILSFQDTHVLFH